MNEARKQETPAGAGPLPFLRGLGRAAAALIVGAVLGIALEVGAALMLYSGLGLLSAAGFILAVALAALAAGIWVGTPHSAGDELNSAGRWVAAVASLLFAGIYATGWEHERLLRAAPLGRAGAVLLMIAWPAYSLGALLATLAARGRRASEADARGPAVGGAPASAAPLSTATPVAALAGAALGVAWAGARLIPRLPAGYVLGGAGLALVVAALFEARRRFAEERSGAMRGRSAIVTGVGARGQVGYAVAEALLRAGARVLVTGRSADLEAIARELAQHGEVVAIRADLSEPAGAQSVVDAAAEHLGGLDVLVNVAGGLSVIKPLAETADDEWTRELERNAHTTFLMCRAALPLLRRNHGAIINFASPAGIRAKASLGAYSAAKAAVVALTRALALEEAKNGVRANAIAPGMVDTAQNRKQASEASRPEVTAADRQVRNVNRESVANADAVRWVSRQQVADVVLFLAGDAASGISGETIPVLGGAAE